MTHLPTTDHGAPLFGEAPILRKSASHGEAGYARSARDFYPTEPWVTRALCRAVVFIDDKLSGAIWEPACGDGRMVRELEKAGYAVLASDIADYGYRPMATGVDFLRDSPPGLPPSAIAAIVTNPPFDLAKQFVARGCEWMRERKGKVAILQRHEFDAPRSNWPLFRDLPFAAKLILPRRPRWSDDDKASPRFPYAWYLWDWRHEGEPIIRWLADEKSSG